MTCDSFAINIDLLTFNDDCVLGDYPEGEVPIQTLPNVFLHFFKLNRLT